MLFAYLGEQLTENGRNGVPLFQPLPRTDNPVVPAAMRERFIRGLATPVGEPGWRRAWIAVDGQGGVAGHIDLRANPDDACGHRTQLGMGVHRDCRRLGLGSRLIDTAVAWAGETGFTWIDLEVLSANVPAIGLYLRKGFLRAGEFDDMYRIDGEQHACTFMAYRL